jgi:hypothetical protein
MKKITILLFSILISLNSYGDWKKYAYSEGYGNTYYIDIDSIKKENGGIYFLNLVDLSKPDDYGDVSVIGYNKGNCAKDKLKTLTLKFYKQHMGKGEISEELLDNKGPWLYLKYGTSVRDSLNVACDSIMEKLGKNQEQINLKKYLLENFSN